MSSGPSRPPASTSATSLRLSASSVSDTAPAERMPAISNLEMRSRSSAGSDRVTSEIPAASANSRSTEASWRSTPRGSTPFATTVITSVSPGRLRTAETVIPSWPKVAGRRAKTGRSSSITVTVPRVSSIRRSSARDSRSSPSDTHKVSNLSSVRFAAQRSSAAGSGSQGLGVRFGNCFANASAAWNGISPTGGSVRRASATGRAASAASANAASMRSIRRFQSGASAQVPSTRTRSGPVPGSSTVEFRTGPAKPTMSDATASMRSNSSHHGVLSVCVSSSASPRSSVTPGKRLRTGAGGTARNSSHRTGSPASATSSHGAAKPIPAIENIYRRRSRAEYIQRSADCAVPLVL